VYNTLLDDLRCVKELSLKHCRELRFAEAGHVFAAALGITVAVYSTLTLQPLATFTGHIGIVRCLAFAKSDRVLFTTGADGNILAWDLITYSKVRWWRLVGCGHVCVCVCHDEVDWRGWACCLGAIVASERSVRG
jgi:WD40 repeat protein